MLSYQQKKFLSLGGRLGLGAFFLMMGVGMLIIGLTALTINEIIPDISDEKNDEKKNITSDPELFWLPSYDVYLDSLDTELLVSGSKIKVRVFAGSPELMDSFTVYIFHEDFLDRYQSFLDGFNNNSFSIPKLKNEWVSYGVFINNNPQKCVRIDNMTNTVGTPICNYDYNAEVTRKFEHTGKYYALFTSNLSNQTNVGYLEPASIFSLRDSLTVDIKESVETVLLLNQAQQKLNKKAESLSLIGIGVALIIGSFALFDSYVHSKSRISNEEEKIRRTKQSIINAELALRVLDFASWRRDDFVIRHNSSTLSLKKDEEMISFNQNELTMDFVIDTLKKIEATQILPYSIEQKIPKLYREIQKKPYQNTNNDLEYPSNVGHEKLHKMIKILEKDLHKYDATLQIIE